jgi:acetyltransferase-like isoleucine patch superfamily enzyme
MNITKIILKINNYLLKKIEDGKRREIIDFLLTENIISGDHIDLKGIPYIIKHPKSTFKIGKNCTIINKSRFNIAGISHPSVLATATSSAKLIIGNYTGLSGNFICCVNKISIGNNVNIGTGAKIYDTDFHPIDYLERRKNPGFDLSKIPNAPIEIGNDVWIGAEAVILKGVTLGNRVIVGAGSIVTKSFPSDCIVGGNPARIIKHI